MRNLPPVECRLCYTGQLNVGYVILGTVRQSPVIIFDTDEKEKAQI